MKLGKLRLKNFLSYDEAEIDFTNIGKALIVGQNNGDISESNGSGKTNLFEAIGWNGWGESKAETVDLNVKNDKDDCLVEHEFEHDGKMVKISRGRNKKNSTSTLDFIIDGVVSNGANVTETNKKIEEFLSLDYETFVNSVYIKQDDVHSLANTKNPNEGRELLEKVLNLGEYDKYHEMAKAESFKLDFAKTNIETYLEENKDVETSISSFKEDIVLIKKGIAEIEESSAKKKKELAKKKKEIDILKLQQVNFKHVTDSISRLEKEIATLKTEYADLKQKALSYKTAQEAKAVELKTRIGKEDSIIAERRALEKEIETSKKRAEEIKPLENDILILNNLNKDKTHGIDSLKEEISVISESNKGKDKEVNELDKQRGVLVYRGKEVKAKKIAIEDRLKNPTIKVGDTCSVCLNDIKPENFEHYQKHLSEELIPIESELSGIIKEVKEIDSKLVVLSEAIKSNNDRISTMNETIALANVEISSNNDKIDDLESKVSDIKSSLLTDSIVSSRNGLIDQKLLEINRFKKELTEVESGEGLKEWKTMVTSKKSSYEAKEQDLTTFNEQLTNLGEFDEDAFNTLESEIEDIQEELDSYVANIASSQTDIENKQKEIKYNEGVISEMKSKKEEIEEIVTKIEAYKDLQTAFSSQGIRSYILENAIEELEKESNVILSKLSGGRLAIAFKTKKEIKKSKTDKHEKMTFEVLINDGQKTFPFNSYSGGEKFRISFVLRVALSKLLLRRAKSKLEFLIVDEAFSPMDTAGIEKIIEVINELQSDFRTILVITHRADTKAYFDQTITVEKTESGSRIV